MLWASFGSVKWFAREGNQALLCAREETYSWIGPNTPCLTKVPVCILCVYILCRLFLCTCKCLMVDVRWTRSLSVLPGEAMTRPVVWVNEMRMLPEYGMSSNVFMFLI